MARVSIDGRRRQRTKKQGNYANYQICQWYVKFKILDSIKCERIYFAYETGLGVTKKTK